MRPEDGIHEQPQDGDQRGRRAGAGLLADDAPGALAGNSNPSAIRTKVKLLNGRGYVFAYNTTDAAGQRDLHLEHRAGVGDGQCREPDARPPPGNSFTDSFGPYQAHVYVLGNGGASVPGGGASGPGIPNSGAGAPTVAFVNPAEGATVSQTGTVTLAAAGGTGNYTYILAVNGTGVYTGTNPTFSWNTKNFPNGPQQLTATVKDGSGRTGLAIRNVTMSNASGGLTVSMTQPDRRRDGQWHPQRDRVGERRGKRHQDLHTERRRPDRGHDADGVDQRRDDPVEHAECGRRQPGAGDVGSRRGGQNGQHESDDCDRGQWRGVTAPQLRTADLRAADGRRPDRVGDPALNGVTVSGTHNAIVWVDGAASGSRPTR